LSRNAEDTRSAVLDFQRRERIGLTEAVLCDRKTPGQITDILERFLAHGGACLLTRLDADKAAELPAGIRRSLDYHGLSRTAFFGGTLPRTTGASAAIVSGGTSDEPVCLEAARTLEFHGAESALYQDVGVAGLWRLLERVDRIGSHDVIIVVAGMEGALFSVLGGLVGAPIIAVPTSVGYGVSKGGQLSLNAALSSCAPGLVTVNIDNGYGAACAALRFLNHAAAPG
jgi:NCAIR mutase (PurE)-related protein